MIITMLKSILKDKLYQNDLVQFVNYIWGYCVVIVLGYWLNYLLNTNLIPSQLGLFSYIQGVIGILSPLLCLGFYNTYLRFHQNHTLSAKLLKMGKPFYFLSFIVCGVIVAVLSGAWYTALYGATVFFVEKQYLLRTQMQMLKLNVLRCCELLVPIVFVYVLKYFNFTPDACVMCLLYGVGFCMFLLFPARKGVTAKDVNCKEVYKYLFPIMGTSLLTYFLLNIGVVLAKQMYGLEVAAEWGVALRAVLIFKNFMAIFLIFFPMIYFREAENKKYAIINIYRNVIVLMAVSAAVPLIVFPRFIYMLLGAGKYYSSAHILSLLTICELLSFVSSLYALFFNFEIKTWKITIFKAVNLILFLGGVFLFREKGIMGMALAYLGAGVLCFTMILPCGIIKEMKYFCKN